MSCANLMFSLFLLSPCESGSGTEVSEAVASAISNPQRPAEDIVNDDHTLAVFDPSLRKKTDRFVFRFVRN